jgi:GH15 family glucan-1,4-alpha-glucosidase
VVGRVEDYAIVGDMQSVALICADGSVDWLCLPRFDSEACFAALLGIEDHGQWRIAPADGPGRSSASRRYAGDTLILETQWETADGIARVTDRYCWLRDATITLEALLRTGYTDEAKAWRLWLGRAIAGVPG